MEHITSNIGSTKARRVTRNGKDWLVADVTMIVPGVLKGSQGPLYYPPEEVARNAESWDGFPIVVYHPKDSATARHPDVLHSQWVGHVFRTRVRNSRLVAEAWFDEEATRRVDPRVHQALLNGRPMEVSTGLHTERYPAPPNAQHNGRYYDQVARNYRPDHLAVLPDQVGACSLRDGCGLMVANAKCSCGGTCQQCREQAAGTDNAAWHSLDMTPEKACKIMRDGRVHGKPLTKHQKGLFGAKCGERDAAKNTAQNDSGWLPVANWCNQYGGTTCKDKSKNTKARLKAAKAKSAAGYKPKESATKSPPAKKVVAKPQGSQVKAGAAVAALADKWVGLAHKGKHPDEATRSRQLDEALAGADPHEVARSLGLVSKFPSRKKATEAIKRVVRDRVGMVARSYQ